MKLYKKRKQTISNREQICGCQGVGSAEEEPIGSSGIGDTNYYIQHE